MSYIEAELEKGLRWFNPDADSGRPDVRDFKYGKVLAKAFRQAQARIAELEADIAKIKEYPEGKYYCELQDEMARRMKIAHEKLHVEQTLKAAEAKSAELAEALFELRAAVKAEPVMNNMKYDALGIKVNKALSTEPKGENKP